MKRSLIALLAALLSLGAVGCTKREPTRFERHTSQGTASEEVTTAAGDTELLPPNDPRRMAAASKWDGNRQMVNSTIQIYEFDGIGTEPEPYLIKSAEDLAHLAANVCYGGDDESIVYKDRTRYFGKHFRLECDIDMQGKPWYGIGGNGATWDDETMFQGIFDGNGHVIYNFALADEPMNGLFCYIGQGAILRNLTIYSGSVTLKSNEPVGLLVAGIRYGATIENCGVHIDLPTLPDVVPSVGMIGVIEGADKQPEWAVTVTNCNVSGTTLNKEPYSLPLIAKNR